MEFLPCPPRSWYLAYPHEDNNEAEGSRITEYHEVLAWKVANEGRDLVPVTALPGRDFATVDCAGCLVSSSAMDWAEPALKLYDVDMMGQETEVEAPGAPLVQPQHWGYIVTEFVMPEEQRG